jgi:hypothetical protein
MTFFLAPGNLPLLPRDQTRAVLGSDKRRKPAMVIVHRTDNSNMLNLLNGGAGRDRRRRHDPPRRHPRSGGRLVAAVS